MRIHGLAIGLIMLTGACGYGTDGRQGASTKAAAPTGAIQATSTPNETDLSTDSDVVITGLYGWVDLMPGVGFAGGPHTRLHVKLKVPSQGCTAAGDFSATLTPVAGKQVLTIKRLKEDRCTDPRHPVDLNLNVYGTYRPSARVLINGVEQPVTERIIY